MAFTPRTGATGSLDLSAANAALKEYYDGQKLIDLTYTDHPFLAMLAKDTSFTGRLMPLPVLYGATGGRAAAFGAAVNNPLPPVLNQFQLQRFQNHQVALIDGETLAAGANDVGAFIKTSSLNIDAAISNLSRNVSSVLFRDGTGAISQIGTVSGVSGVVTLSNADDVVQFEVGQILVAAATPGGTAVGTVSETSSGYLAPATGTGIGYIIGIDRDAGTITVSLSSGGAATAPPTWVAGLYLRIYGDVNATATGLAGWLPKVAPVSGDSFFQVDRSKDTTRLAGVRYNGSSQSIEEAIIQTGARLNREGASPDVVIMNYTSWAALAKSLGSKVQYLDHNVAGVSFKGFELSTGKGLVKCFADMDCQAQTAYMLEMKRWTLFSMGDVPRITDEDGTMLLRSATADAFQVRAKAYYQLGCTAPGKNAVVTLSE